MELSYSESKRSTADKSINLNRRIIMNNKIEILKAVVNKPIKVEIKDNLSLVSKYYIYAVYANSCILTKEYISEYIKASDRDSRFKSIKYDNINGIRITA